MIVIFKIQLQTLSGTEVTVMKRRQIYCCIVEISFLLINSRLIPPYALNIYNKARKSSFGQASTDEDGRLRTVHSSMRPCGQHTKIWAQTVHLMDKFGRWTKIIILRSTNGRIFDHGPSPSSTNSDARSRLSF